MQAAQELQLRFKLQGAAPAEVTLERDALLQQQAEACASALDGGAPTSGTADQGALQAPCCLDPA